MQDNTTRMIVVGKVHFVDGKKVGEEEPQKSLGVPALARHPHVVQRVSVLGGREPTCL